MKRHNTWLTDLTHICIVTVLLCFPFLGAGHPIGFEFGYGDRGPEHWGDLKKEWSTCKYGKLQSPIDLRDDIALKVNSTFDELSISYKPTEALMKNEGHAISVRK